MFSTINNIFRVPELRKKIMITLGLLAAYRIGFSIPVPGVNIAEFRNRLLSLSDFLGGALGAESEGAGEGLSAIIANLGAITGGAWKSGAIFCLGIMPYITASIIFSLLQKIIPSLERMAKEGEAGQQRINQYTRYVTVVLCLIHSLFIFYQILPGEMWEGSRDFLHFMQFFAAVTAGALLMMWIGEKITEYGIGNGISLLIMAGIIARMPNAALVLVPGLFFCGGQEYAADGYPGGCGPDSGVYTDSYGRGADNAGYAPDNYPAGQARARDEDLRRAALLHAVARQPCGRYAGYLCLAGDDAGQRCYRRHDSQVGHGIGNVFRGEPA